MLKNKSTKKKVNKELLRRPDIYVAALSNKEELTQARSATSGEEFNSLDERIDCEVERLSKKIEVSFLQQEDKESHVVENTVEGMTTDMVVKGRTLQNLVKYKLNNQKVGGTSMSATLCTNEMFKINTTYTIIYTINSIESGTGKTILNFSGGMTSPDITLKSSDLVGTHKQTFTLNTLPSTKYRNVSLYHIDSNTTKFISDVIIVEGEVDFTLNYFEGVKSFGQEKGKISILSNNKNFVKNLNDYIEEGNYVYADPYIYFPIYYPINSNNLYCSYYCNNLPSGSYLLLTKRPVYNVEYQDVLIANNSGKLEGGKIVKSKTLNENNSNIIYLGYAINGKKIDDIKNYIKLNDLKVQLEIGTNKTEYVCDYDKKDILLQDLGFDEGLRGLNNAVYDELNDMQNVAIKRVGKYTFTGNETSITKWLTVTDESFTGFYVTNDDIPNLTSNRSLVVCNNFPSVSGVITRRNMYIAGGSVNICIEKSVLTTPDIEGFKTWLKANPTSIYYELAEPVETPLDENIKLKVYNEKTYVSFENAISGTSSFKAPVNTVATISRLNRENRALEEENKNLRQDFESTTLVLTDSDLELVKQNVDMDFRLMEVEFALDIPQAILSSDIKFKNKKGEVKSMARTPYEMMKIVILSGDYDREDYMHKVGKYYERGRMTKEEHDELMSLMTADEVISK
ncbi:MAG: hypothetical protein E7H33_09160 [Clostridium perfringens]|nr:hypothetical protein [Clostridium perfringens]